MEIFSPDPFEIGIIFHNNTPKAPQEFKKTSVKLGNILNPNKNSLP